MFLPELGRVLVPKPHTSSGMLGKDKIFGESVPHSYHNLVRFLGTLTKVKGEHFFISWDIAQVKLKVSLLSLLQCLKWPWLLIKTTFHYYSSS